MRDATWDSESNRAFLHRNGTAPQLSCVLAAGVCVSPRLACRRMKQHAEDKRKNDDLKESVGSETWDLINEQLLQRGKKGMTCAPVTVTPRPQPPHDVRTSHPPPPALGPRGGVGAGAMALARVS